MITSINEWINKLIQTKQNKTTKERKNKKDNNSKNKNSFENERMQYSSNPIGNEILCVQQ
jgi:hypothetical protein